MAYRSDKEETYRFEEIDLGTGTNNSSMPERDNTNPLYAVAPTFHETATDVFHPFHHHIRRQE